MSARHIEALQKCMEDRLTSAVEDVVGGMRAVRLLFGLTFDVNVEVVAYSSSLFVKVTKREDLETGLRIAPPGTHWQKEVGYDGAIIYMLTFDDGFMVRISAEGDALPPTCKVVEEEIEVPAQAAYKRKKKVVVCEDRVLKEDAEGKVDVPSPSPSVLPLVR